MAEFTLIECNIKCVGLEIKTKLTRLTRLCGVLITPRLRLETRSYDAMCLLSLHVI
jgi:hypothetical protein